MNIAMPLVNGRLCQRFGQCALFAVITVDDETKRIVKQVHHIPPPTEPGMIPRWLDEEHKVNVVIAGGMGVRALEFLRERGIEVILGVADGTPEELVNAYLSGTLETHMGACESTGPGACQ